MFKIDKGIPVPPKRGHVRKYPWREMEVGDSFFVPGMTAASAAAGCLGAKKATGWTFRYRTVDGGVRFWRTACPLSAARPSAEPLTRKDP